MIAGRCLCGRAFAVFGKREWDEHLRCIGVRWCGVCGEAARFHRECPACDRRRSKECKARARAANAPSYEREKERKRERYRNDPAWRDTRLASLRRRFAADPTFRSMRVDYQRALRERRGAGIGPLVSCACGCGATFTRWDASGRPRRFRAGHHRRVQRSAA